MNNARIRAAVQYCQSRKLSKAVFVIPFPVSVEDVLLLRDQNCCAAVILRNPAAGLTAQISNDWLGSFADDGVTWQLPGRLGSFIFLGPPAMLTKGMLHQVANSGMRSIACEGKLNHFVEIPLFRFRLWHLGDAIIHKVSNLSAGSPAHLLIGATKRVPGMRMLWHRLLRRESRTAPAPFWHARPRVVAREDLDLGYFRALVGAAHTAAGAEPLAATPGRILLVNAGLAAGGAERQIVNTLIGLKTRGFHDVTLLGEYLHGSPGLDFYLPQLTRAGISAAPVAHDLRLSDPGCSSFSGQLVDLLGKLPATMADEILNLVAEFKARRPSVVHAWQDSTSIKAGIAGLIAGVPRIVLGSRNVIPENFGYYQDYMRSAYQALAAADQVTFLNNSNAGATDYCRWLELPRDRFHVVRNGVDLTGLTRVGGEALSGYRRALRIREGAPVVGSIFRFWAEKRPILWLDTARMIAELVPDAHFLLIGDGPMRGKMEAYVRRAGLETRIHMPGTRADIATPLSAMSLFMLTSEFEGTPNVVLEAQWLGLPVVATDAGGVPEAISQGETGWCCTPPDAAVIAAKVRMVLADPSCLAQLRQTGPRFVNQNFGLSQMLDQTLDLYDFPNEPL